MWALIWIIVTLIIVFSTLFIGLKSNKQASVISNKTFNITDLLDYKNNSLWDSNEKQLVELMKKYQYCSKDTTKSDITFIKDGGLINLKCNWWFSKKFINFLNENNYYNKYRFYPNHYIFVYKDTEWTKDIKHIKDTDNYKNITIAF